MHLPRCPIEIQWMSAPWRAGGLVQLGKGFLLSGDDRDVMALRSRGLQHQKGKASVAGDEAQLHCRIAESQDGRMDCGKQFCNPAILQSCNGLFIRQDLFGASRGAAEDHAPLR